jgi:hypothetical protein
MKIITVSKNGQLKIDGVLQFNEGTYLSGTPYKNKITVSEETLSILKTTATSVRLFPFDIKNFTYGGFMGMDMPGMADYRGCFAGWTKDPGIVRMRCSDGETRIIPTFAIPACALLPKCTIDKKDKVLFGEPSSSKIGRRSSFKLPKGAFECSTQE